MISVADPVKPRKLELSSFSSPPPTKPSSDTTGDHIFRSKLPEIAISNHLPLHTYCFENLLNFPDKPCLISGSSGKTYSFFETHLIA
ncbi:hypothetical protein CRYUN_Cryun09bG0168400 [Craigia yunnanensis]